MSNQGLQGRWPQMTDQDWTPHQRSTAAAHSDVMARVLLECNELRNDHVIFAERLEKLAAEVQVIKDKPFVADRWFEAKEPSRKDETDAATKS